MQANLQEENYAKKHNEINLFLESSIKTKPSSTEFTESETRTNQNTHLQKSTPIDLKKIKLYDNIQILKKNQMIFFFGKRRIQ